MHEPDPKIWDNHDQKRHVNLYRLVVLVSKYYQNQQFLQGKQIDEMSPKKLAISLKEIRSSKLKQKKFNTQIKVIIPIEQTSSNISKFQLRRYV